MTLRLKEIVGPGDALVVEMTGNRTKLFGIYNNTPLGIEVAFGQIRSRYSGNGWIADTGVFRFASGGSGNLPNLFDPLPARNWRIAGQWGAVSILIGGHQIDDEYPWSGEDSFYPDLTWVIGAASARDASPRLTRMSEEVRSDE